MSVIKLNLSPSPTDLRQFGWIALGAFGLIGAALWWRWLPIVHLLGSAAPTVAIVLWSLGGVAALFSLVYPRANLPLYVGLTLIAFPIGFVVSHVLMALIFFGLFTPVALVFRLIGRDALDRKLEPARASYWVDYEPPKSVERYFRQY